MKSNLKRKEQEQFASASNDAVFGTVEKVTLGIGFGVASMASQAAVDTADILTAIAAVAAAVALIGAAVVLVKLGVKTYKWLSTAF